MTTETLDSEPIRLLAGPECFGCQRQVEMYDEDRAAGYQCQGGAIAVTQATIGVQLRPDVQGGSGAIIAAGGIASPFTVLDASGLPFADRSFPGYDLSISVEIAWFPVQLTWQVASLSLVVA
ncbi:MAG: hypothetical protein H0T54_07520 [Geodermatophilaceae bacterium]|nr:hypothetical protein [Geodermatophilaceae bacterium]